MLTFDLSKASAGENEATRLKQLRELLDQTKPASAGSAGAPEAAPSPSGAPAPAAPAH
jgi:hypothetical protein